MLFVVPVRDDPFDAPRRCHERIEVPNHDLLASPLPHWISSPNATSPYNSP